MIAEVLPPNAPMPEGSEALERKMTALEARVVSLEISSDPACAAACALEKEIAEQLEHNRKKTQDAVDAGLAAHRAALATQKAFCEPLEAARRLLKQKIGAYREEQRRLAALETERRRLAAAQNAEDEALDRAATLERLGRTDEAERALARPSVAPVVAVEKPASNGVSIRTVWSAEIYDLPSLIRWAAEDPDTRGCYLLPNGPVLNAQARALKGSMNPPEGKKGPFPGVRAVSRFA